MTDKIRVYFTVDTETSLGGAWRNALGPLPVSRTMLGQNGSGSYGVPLIMDILEQYGFRATFFMEVFCSYLRGATEVCDVFDCIQKRGHDVQLHLHPVQRFYRDFVDGQGRREQDLIFQFSPEEQRDLIGEGVALFRKFSGVAPRAFRAGCYGASEITLWALRENDIVIDSSYNLAYLDRTCGFRERLLNVPRVMEGVYEFPVTNFQSVRAGAYKNLEISAVSVREIMETIRLSKKSGCRDFVLVFHSFSFLKNRDVRFEKARPGRIVTQRFRRLCEELAKMHGEVEVCVFGDLDLARVNPGQPNVIPALGWFPQIMRKAVQGIDYIPWI
jgi:peptidoglycan/xylan/chitin deacetylase (PgdA/CDA1 family)